MPHLCSPPFTALCVIVYHQINSLVQCLDVMDVFKVSTTKLQLNITIFHCDAFHLSCTTT